jgi:hypothetical protein
MKSSVTNVLMALVLIAIGVGIAVAGIYIGEIDDAPGAAQDIALISWLNIVPWQG